MDLTRVATPNRLMSTISEAHHQVLRQNHPPKALSGEQFAALLPPNLAPQALAQHRGVLTGT